jgi:hypothetical protein
LGNGFSKDAIFVLRTAINAAYVAIWARQRWMGKKTGFIRIKPDNTYATLGDDLVTHYLVGKLSRRFNFFCIAEEYPGEKFENIWATEINYDRFFSVEVGAVLDGIDGTLFYILNSGKPFNFSIWFGLARRGKPWCSIFVEVGPDLKGILEVAIAEAGRGAWLYKPGLPWKRLRAAPWDDGRAPNVTHGLPFRDVRFDPLTDYLSGPAFQWKLPKVREIIPIGRAVIDIITGKDQLFLHALLPPHDWYPACLFIKEAGYCQNWYRIGSNGVPYFLEDSPGQPDYSPASRLCLNIGVREFVKIAKNFLLKKIFR